MTMPAYAVTIEAISHHSGSRRRAIHPGPIASGIAQATFSLVLFSDADGQYEPDDLPSLLDRVNAADIVAGYRLRRADRMLRRVVSGGYNFLARRLIGVPLRDINCAFKVMGR